VVRDALDEPAYGLLKVGEVLGHGCSDDGMGSAEVLVSPLVEDQRR
jgi:hypothetical protein